MAPGLRRGGGAAPGRACRAAPTGEPRLLLWPEAAVTDPLEDARTDEHQAMAQFERTRAASLLGPNDHLLTGGIAVASNDGAHVDGAANSIFVLAPGGRVVGRYDKAHLVPYGEYLPMRPLLSAIGLSRLAPGDIDFNAGPGPRTIDLGGQWGKVGFQLCYEIIFSGQVVDWQQPPATSSSTRRTTPGSGAGARRSISPRRGSAPPRKAFPVLRSTPTGISAVIDARGNVVQSLPWRTAGVIDAVLPPAANSADRCSPGSAMSSRCCSASLLIIGGIVLGRRRR